MKKAPSVITLSSTGLAALTTWKNNKKQNIFDRVSNRGNQILHPKVAVECAGPSCIREVRGWNLGQESGILTDDSNGFPQSHQVNDGRVSQFLRHHFLQHPFQFIIHESSCNSTSLSVCLSVCLSIYLSIYLSMPLQPFAGLGRFFSFLIFCTVGRTPGRGITPSQGRYLHTELHKQN
jgi:hypothetical protein